MLIFLFGEMNKIEPPNDLRSMFNLKFKPTFPEGGFVSHPIFLKEILNFF